MTRLQAPVGTGVAPKRRSVGQRFGSQATDPEQRTPLRRRERLVDDQSARDLDDVACCVSGCSGGNLTIRDLGDRGEWNR